MKISRPHTFACSFIFVFLVTLFVFTAFFLPEKYVYLTSVGLISGRVQFFFFAIAFLLSLRLSLSRSCHYWPSYLLLVMLFLVALSGYGSWGQELFGIVDGSQYHLKNLVPAANIVVMFIYPAAGWKIPVGLFWILYGFIYPLALKNGRLSAVWLNKHRIMPPPFCLWPFYVSGAILMQQLIGLNDADVAAVFLSFALASTTLVHVALQKDSIKPVGDSSPLQTVLSRRVAHYIIVLFYGTVILAAGVAVQRNQSAEFRNHTEREYAKALLNSAEQYRRLNQYINGVRLYQKVLEGYPDNVQVLRRLASCYRENGNEEEFLKLYARALQVDLAKYGRHPENVAVNLSLAQTFMLLSHKDKIQYHLDKALSCGKKQVHHDPDSAHAVYWLGQAYFLKGDKDAALIQFEKAFAMNPQSQRYKKMLDRARTNHSVGAGLKEFDHYSLL